MSKGGKYFIQTSVGNFLSASADSFPSLLLKKRKFSAVWFRVMVSL